MTYRPIPIPIPIPDIDYEARARCAKALLQDSSLLLLRLDCALINWCRHIAQTTKLEGIMTRTDVHEAVNRRRLILVEYYCRKQWPHADIRRISEDVIMDSMGVGREPHTLDRLHVLAVEKGEVRVDAPLPSTVIASMETTEGAFFARGWLQGFEDAQVLQDKAPLTPEMPDYMVEAALDRLQWGDAGRVLNAYIRGMKEGWHHFYMAVWLPPRLAQSVAKEDPADA